MVMVHSPNVAWYGWPGEGRCGQTPCTQLPSCRRSFADVMTITHLPQVQRECSRSHSTKDTPIQTNIVSLMLTAHLCYRFKEQ